MLRLDQALPDALRQLGVQDRIQRYQLQVCWAQIVGEHLARQSEPLYIQNGTLFLRTTNPMWSQEILLRQVDILKRAADYEQKLGGQKIKKLRCKVGALKRLPQPNSHDDDSVDWSDIQLSEAAVQRVERIVEGFSDPKLQQSARRALLQLERRRIWSFRQGMQPCLLCSNMQEQNICYLCHREKIKKRQLGILRLLSRRPWLRYKDLQAKVPNIKTEEFLQAHRQLKSIWERNYWIARDGLEGGKPFPSGLRQMMLDLAMMTTGADYSQIQDRHLIRTFGKLWGPAFRADLVPSKEQIETYKAGRKLRAVGSPRKAPVRKGREAFEET